MATYTIKLSLTEEQENTIKQLYQEHGWTYSRTEVMSKKKRRLDMKCGPDTSAPQQASSSSVSTDASGLQQDGSSPVCTLQDSDCPHCFQTPCVTLHYHQWLGNGQAPCVENSVIRKDKYSKYWKVICNLGGWNDPRYVMKKSSMEEGEWVVTHRREVMPVCVLTCVRNLYPNPKGQPYMGHRWE